MTLWVLAPLCIAFSVWLTFKALNMADPTTGRIIAALLFTGTAWGAAIALIYGALKVPCTYVFVDAHQTTVRWSWPHREVVEVFAPSQLSRAAPFELRDSEGDITWRARFTTYPGQVVDFAVRGERLPCERDCALFNEAVFGPEPESGWLR